jgi:hypothetical protein
MTNYYWQIHLPLELILPVYAELHASPSQLCGRRMIGTCETYPEEGEYLMGKP